MHYTICLKLISSSGQVALPPAFARLEQRGVPVAGHQPIDTIKLELDERASSLESGRIYNQYLGGSGTGGDTIKLELYEMRVWQDLQPISWRWGADGGRNNLCGRRTHTVGTNTQYGREYECTQLNTMWKRRHALTVWQKCGSLMFTDGGSANGADDGGVSRSRKQTSSFSQTAEISLESIIPHSKLLYIHICVTVMLA